MFTTTNTIRTIIAISALGAGLACSGGASAAVPLNLRAGAARTTVVAPPTVSYHYLNRLDPNKVGGAGNASTGWCEDMVNFYNKDLERADDAENAGDQETFALESARAEEDLKAVEDHCLIVD